MSLTVLDPDYKIAMVVCSQHVAFLLIHMRISESIFVTSLDFIMAQIPVGQKQNKQANQDRPQ